MDLLETRGYYHWADTQPKRHSGDPPEKESAAQLKLRVEHTEKLASAQVRFTEAKAKVKKLLDAGAGDDELSPARRERSEARDEIKDREEAIARADDRLKEIAAEQRKNALDKQRGEFAIEAERRVVRLEVATDALVNKALVEWLEAAEGVAEFYLDGCSAPVLWTEFSYRIATVSGDDRARCSRQDPGRTSRRRAAGVRPSSSGFGIGVRA